MATASKYASYHTAITTGYTNPSYAYEDGTNYATAAPGKNADISAYWGFAAFSTSDIPNNSIINSVKVTHFFYVSVNTSVAEEYIQVFLNTTGQGTEQGNTSEPLTDTELYHTVTSGISLTNLRSADTVRARTRSRRGNSNTAVTFYVDYVQITVDYTPPSPIYSTISCSSSVTAVLEAKPTAIYSSIDGSLSAVVATLKGKGTLFPVHIGNELNIGNLRGYNGYGISDNPSGQIITCPQKKVNSVTFSFHYGGFPDFNIRCAIWSLSGGFPNSLLFLSPTIAQASLLGNEDYTFYFDNANITDEQVAILIYATDIITMGVQDYIQFDITSPEPDYHLPYIIYDGADWYSIPQYTIQLVVQFEQIQAVIRSDIFGLATINTSSEVISVLTGNQSSAYHTQFLYLFE